jgi:hypothetical protein
MTTIVFKKYGCYDWNTKTEVRMQLSAVSKIKIYPISIFYEAILHYCEIAKRKSTNEEMSVEDEVQKELFDKGFDYGGMGCVIVIETKKGDVFAAPSLESAFRTKDKIMQATEGCVNLNFSSPDVIFREYKSTNLPDFGWNFGFYLIIDKALKSHPLHGMPYDEKDENTMFYLG